MYTLSHEETCLKRGGKVGLKLLAGYFRDGSIRVDKCKGRSRVVEDVLLQGRLNESIGKFVPVAIHIGIRPIVTRPVIAISVKGCMQVIWPLAQLRYIKYFMNGTHAITFQMLQFYRERGGRL